MPSRRPTRRGLSGVVLAIGFLASIGGCVTIEERGPVSMSTDFDDVVHLTAEEPVAVRHLAFEISPPDRAINATLTINAHRFITDTTGEFAEDVTMSVRADDPGVTAASGSPGDARPGAVFVLTELCAEGCQSGVTVIIRGTSEAHPTDQIGLSAKLSVSSSTVDMTNQSPLGTVLSVVDDGEGRFEGDPPAASAHVASPIVVSADEPTARIVLRLRADEALLADPLTYPLVGSLTLRATGDADAHEQLWSHWAPPIGRVTVDGVTTGMGPESAAADIDWLRACTPGEACEVDVAIEIEYDHLLMRTRVNTATANESDPPPPTAFHLTLDALARLEAFDGRPLPSDGLTLEVVP